MEKAAETAVDVLESYAELPASIADQESEGKAIENVDGNHQQDGPLFAESGGLDARIPLDRLFRRASDGGEQKA